MTRCEECKEWQLVGNGYAGVGHLGGQPIAGEGETRPVFIRQGLRRVFGSVWGHWGVSQGCGNCGGDHRCR